MKKIYLQIASLFSIAVLAISCGPDNAKSLAEMETGVSLFGNGNYKQAIPHFTTAKTNPNFDSIATRWLRGCQLGIMMDSARNISDTMMASLKKYEDDWFEVNDNPDKDWGCFSSADCDKGGIYFSNLGIYRGTRADSVRSGKGAQYYELEDSRGVSWGNWVKGKINGQGCFFFDDSLKGEGYVGNYADNQRNGHGTYIFNDHSISEGEFKDGDSQGPGVQYNSDGTIQVGSWNRNSMDGEFIEYDTQGKITHQIWTMGKLISSKQPRDN